MSKNNEKPPKTDKLASQRRILWAIIIASSVVWIPSFLSGILLLDISDTFGYPIGVVGQIFTVSSIVGVISAIMLGMLTIRIKTKTLIIIGLIAFMVFSVICSLAPSFNIMIASFSLSGLGLAFVMPMSMSLVGEHLPVEKRASAIGWISAAIAIPGLVFGPLIGYVVNIGSWRLAFIVFILPLSILGLFAVLRWIPSVSGGHASEESGVDLFSGFKEIVKNRSALTSLFGYALALASMTALGSYIPSYLRETFLVSTEFVSTVFASVYVVYVLGSIACARVVDRFGRKPVLVVSLLVESILILISFVTPNLWLTLVIIYVANMLMGFFYTVAISLVLEQLPGFQGTMMSLNSAAGNLGMALGSAVGGLILLFYDYGLVGLSLGVLGIIATIIYKTQVKDPTRSEIPNQ